jgi:hypothetical protein
VKGECVKEVRSKAAEGSLEDTFKIMELFIANAKTYVQLSTGALFLTVAYSREVMGIAEKHPIPLNWSLVASWASFLVATLAGATYQYLAVRFLEDKAKVAIHHHRFDWSLAIRRNPWIAYAFMMAAFYLGAAFFTVTAIQGAMNP